MSKRWPFFVSAVAVVVGVTASQGCAVEVNEGDFSGGSVGAGTGGFVPPCDVAPEAVSAKLDRNDEVLRVDGKDATGNPALEPLEIVGVYKAIPSGFTVDACGVNPCAEPELYTLILDLAGDGLEVPDGAFVQLTYTTAADGSFAVVVSNLADITDVPNPVDEEDHLWFQVMQGLKAKAPFSASFSLKATCVDEPGTFQGHDMILSVSGSPELSIVVSLEAPLTWVLPTSPLAGTYEVRDIASFSNGEAALSAVHVLWKGPTL